MKHWIVAAVSSVVVIVALRALLRRVTIMEYDRGLKYVRGQFKGVLAPGVYWFCRHLTRVEVVDVRPRFVTVPGQEVLSSDSITLKVSVAAQYEVADPAIAINKVQNYQEALYLELQLAVRQLIGSVKVDELLEKRNEFGPRLMDLADKKIQTLGLKLHTANIKDIMFPGDLKKVFAQVVKAQKEGLAALERARGETAALRNLANAARMVEGNPALMQLRLLQSIGETSGNTVVLGMPSASTPLPVKTKGVEKPDTQALNPPADATE